MLICIVDAALTMTRTGATHALPLRSSAYGDGRSTSEKMVLTGIRALAT